MTKLQEIQQSLKKGIVESPRLLWALSAAAFTRVKSANDKMLAAFIATKNAQRPTRAYSNFTGQQQIDYAENTRAAKELVDSIDALVSYMKNATEYTPDAEYFLAESDDYDTAVLNKAKFDVVSSRPWGNFRQHTLIIWQPDTDICRSRARVKHTHDIHTVQAMYITLLCACLHG